MNLYVQIALYEQGPHTICTYKFALSEQLPQKRNFFIFIVAFHQHTC